MAQANTIDIKEWNETLQLAMVNILNYRLSGGPLDLVVEGAGQAVDFVDTHIPHETAARFRQELGGIFTSTEQLLDIPGVEPAALERLAYLVREMDLGKLNALAPQTTWHNQVDAYVNGPDCLNLILEEISRAERYLHLSVMLFFNDRAGNRIAQALIDALARGVIVRVMVDFGVTAFGYENNLQVGDFKSIAERLKAAGGKVIDTFHNCYSKADWPGKREELASQGVPESSLLLQDYVQEQIVTGTNVVNHRKFIAIDGITSIVGSINVGDQYLFDTPIQTTGSSDSEGRQLGYPSREEEWHDGCIRIRGAAARSLNRTFAFQWTVLGGDGFDPEDDFYDPDVDLHYGEEQCTVFTSFPGNPVNLIRQYHLQLLQYAADETIIVNPYLIDEAFWERLRSLDEGRARHITICNPLHVNDHLTNLAAVRSHMYEPFEKGVAFYDYSFTKRFSHWKISYDKRSDSVFHGSYNLNERSALHDFELGILIKSKPFADQVRKMIAYDLSVSEPITDSKAFFKHPALHPSTYLNKITEYFT
jgi:cardiolipin synthase